MKKGFFILLMMTAVLSAAPVSNLNDASYIIVVNESLNDSRWLNDLVSLKESEGFDVGVLEITNTDFNNLSSAWTRARIKQSLSNIYYNGNKKLKYILLAGSANSLLPKFVKNFYNESIMYEYFASADMCNFIPGSNLAVQNEPLFVGDEDLTGSQSTDFSLADPNGIFSSDAHYGDFEGNSLSEVSVGRVPAKNITDMINYVTKLRNYSNNLTTSLNELVGQKCLMSLINDEAGCVLPERTRNFVTKHLPIPSGNYQTLVDLRASNYVGNHANLNTAFKSYFTNGLVLCSYMTGEGRVNELHPAVNYYTASGLNGYKDHISSFPTTSSGLFPVIVMPICNRGDYDRLTRVDADTINKILRNQAIYSDGVFRSDSLLLQSFLFSSDKGAIGFVNHKGNSHLEEDYLFGQVFFDVYYNGVSRLGDLADRAMAAIVKVFPELESRVTTSGVNVNENIHLGRPVILGDPALLLNRFTYQSPQNNPQNLSVRSDAGNLLIQWDAVAGADGYSVGLGTDGSDPFTFIRTTNTSLRTNAFPLANISNGQQYKIEVRAFKIVNGTISFNRLDPLCVSGIADFFVSAPANVSAQAYGGGIKVTWDAVTDPDISVYRIVRMGDGGREMTVDVSWSPNGYTDMTAVFLKKYHYMIYALDQNGNISMPAKSNIAMRHARVRVYARDLHINSANSSNPVFHVENFGEPEFSNFIVKYWFAKAHNSLNELVVADYHTPGSSVSKVIVDEDAGLGYVAFHFTSVLQPGQKTADENAALHFAKWTLYNSSTDFSNQGLTDQFQETERITISKITDDGEEVHVYGVNLDLIPLEVPQNFDFTIMAKDDATWSNTESKPSFYLENHGKTMRNFKARYYFTVEDGKIPVMNTYYSGDWTPLGITHVSGNDYYFEFLYPGQINSGEVTMWGTGMGVSLHYANWSNWVKSNDYSNENLSSTFSPVSKIVLLDFENNLIYGQLP